MSNDNCQQFEFDIALAIEAELPAVEQSLLNAHLENCVGCQQFAAELASSQQALKQYGAPLLDNAMLDNLRQQVLITIANQPLTFWQRWFGWLIVGNRLSINRWRFAAAFCALIIIAVSTIFIAFYQHNSHKQSATDQQSIAKLIDTRPLRNDVDHKENLSARSTSAPLAINSNSHHHHLIRHALRLPSSKQSITDQPLPDEMASADNAANLTTATATKAPAETLRMEIQTADPNVRIIWLVNNKTNSDHFAPS